MLDVDELIGDLDAAAREADALLAVRDVLDRALADPAAVAAALPAECAELTPLHRSDRLTVLKVVWAPKMWIHPHDHLMWAAIGIYGGREDNVFYRRADDRIVESGRSELATADVALLGDDVIHGVVNPVSTFTGAIHVYGGDLLGTARRSWEADTLIEADPPDPATWFARWNDDGDTA
jgi:predicted metal-dependent enzyme (double-stranded beta helix superfamily)